MKRVTCVISWNDILFPWRIYHYKDVAVDASKIWFFAKSYEFSGNWAHTDNVDGLVCGSSNSIRIFVCASELLKCLRIYWFIFNYRIKKKKRRENRCPWNVWCQINIDALVFIVFMSRKYAFVFISFWFCADQNCVSKILFVFLNALPCSAYFSSSLCKNYV